MKKAKSWLIVLLLLTLVSSSAMAEAPAKIPDPTAASKKMAQALSEITGVAISPLLGMSAVGAIKYFKTPVDQRDRLPWYANPLFWVPAFIIVGLCVFKDAAGATVLPTVLKKPFDALETMEHKVSGLIATGAFVPLVAQVFSAPDEAPNASITHLSHLGFATIDLHWLYNALITPFAMVAFVLVCLASNAINILILLSPFTTIDTGLKLFRTFLLGTVVVSAWANPWFGAAWAAIIVIISYFIGGWSFRLSHFGLAFIWDYFTFRKHRFQPDPVENKMFLGRKIQKVPPRTYGKLSHNDKGEFVFHYHPWLVLPKRTLTLPPGDYEAGRGVFYSEIVQVQGDSAQTVFLLPPRYLGHEEKLVPIYKLRGTREVGLRAAWGWFKNLFSGKQAAQPA
jgi:hypothetical protein